MPGRERQKKGRLVSNPLGHDINADRFAQAKRDQMDDDDAADVDKAGFLIPSRTTQRILRTARKQLETIPNEELLDNEEDGEVDDIAALDAGLRDLLNAEEAPRSSFFEDAEDDDGELVELEYDDTESVMSEVPSDYMHGDVGGAAAMYGIDDEEARLLQKLQPSSRVQSRNLADMIMEKIKDKETTLQNSGRHFDDGRTEDAEEMIDARVARVYTAIGSVLKRYTSGKIPKAFKILPNIKNWEELLMLTKPDQWSPHATYQATRIFAANLNERMAQRFYAAVLLPIVHEHLLEEKKLHPALYMAVRKALFKPVAFFKGFLLPLATDEECTLKEALVVASVLQRCHLPPVPTAVTIVKIAQLPFSGPCSVLLRVLIDKKMALPYQAIDALVGYFHRFIKTHNKEERLPVLWHQTLLSFTQRYKNDFTDEQLNMLSQVINVHFHYLITPEIRREINAAVKVRRV